MKSYQQHGFTLIELLVTIGIAGILIAIALPNISQFIKNESLTSFRNTLFTDLNLARSTSVSRNQPVIVCVSSNQTSCEAGSFKDGWIVAVDTDSNGTIDNNDELLRVQQEIENVDITFGSTLALIEFDNRGFSPDGVDQISVCDDRGDQYGKVITISVTGRIGRGDNPTCP